MWLDNTGPDATSVDRWVLFDGKLGLPLESAIYGEGFQMLAQTMGNWQSPQPVGRCPDASVYRITDDNGYHTVHNLLLVEHGKGWLLLAFASWNLASANAEMRRIGESVARMERQFESRDSTLDRMQVEISSNRSLNEVQNSRINNLEEQQRALRAFAGMVK